MESSITAVKSAMNGSWKEDLRMHTTGSERTELETLKAQASQVALQQAWASCGSAWEEEALQWCGRWIYISAAPRRLTRLSGVFIDGIKYSTEYTLLGSSHCCRVARNHCTVTLSRNPESMSVISEPTGAKNTSFYWLHWKSYTWNIKQVMRPLGHIHNALQWNHGLALTITAVILQNYNVFPLHLDTSDQTRQHH